MLVFDTIPSKFFFFLKVQLTGVFIAFVNKLFLKNFDIIFLENIKICKKKKNSFFSFQKKFLKKFHKSILFRIFVNFFKKKKKDKLKKSILVRCNRDLRDITKYRF